MGKSRDSKPETIEEMRRVPPAVCAAALEHARTKDLRGDNGITGRVDELLDEMNAGRLVDGE